MDLFDENCIGDWNNIGECVVSIKNKLKIKDVASNNHI
jgi:hypothetical protein